MAGALRGRVLLGVGRERSFGSQNPCCFFCHDCRGKSRDLQVVVVPRSHVPISEGNDTTLCKSVLPITPSTWNM